MRRLIRRSARTGDDASVAADTLLRLAVLLQAGIAPGRAWDRLAELGDPIAERVLTGVADGLATADAIERAGRAPDETRTPPEAGAHSGAVWREVAGAWRVATTVGAPLADSLRAIAAALRDTQEARDEVRVALAEPAATARLMTWLPLVGVALGMALGFDTFGVLVATPAGTVCVVVGAVLMLVARWWTARLVARARAAAAVPGLGSEVLAIALSAGASVERARSLTSRWLGAEPSEVARDLLGLSQRAGVPAVELLRAAASLERHRARVEARLRAARLATGLLLPLGVCTLPAFLLLGVAPMLLSVMGAVGPSPPLMGASVP
ncbi:type II secretion system F family protein [Microbacter sp. GSS18]|nr:type II secretion system F family protein [Microbacter sp. GSS18]